MRSAYKRDMKSRPARALRFAGSALIAVACLTGCTILDPHVPTPDLDVPNLYTNQQGKGSPTASPYDFVVFKSKYLAEPSLSAGASISTSALQSRASRRPKPMSGLRPSRLSRSSPRAEPQIKATTYKAAVSGTQTILRNLTGAIRSIFGASTAHSSLPRRQTNGMRASLLP